jgi:hypothetical protein
MTSRTWSQSMAKMSQNNLYIKLYIQILQIDALESAHTELFLIMCTKHNHHVVLPNWRQKSHKHLVTNAFLAKTGLGNQMKSLLYFKRACLFIRFITFQHDSVFAVTTYLNIYISHWKYFPLLWMHNWAQYYQEFLACWKIPGISYWCRCFSKILPPSCM